MPPDVVALREFLNRVRRRLAWIAVAEGAASGLALAIVLALLGWPRIDALWQLIVVGLAAAITGALLRSRFARREPAALVEARAPESRNLIRTAAELCLRQKDGYVPSLVFGQAARLVRTLDVRALIPARMAIVATTAAFVVWAMVVARPVLPFPATLGGLGATHAPNGLPIVDAVTVTIEPPAYTGRDKQTLKDPARVEALVGSTITLSVRARAARMLIETLGGHDSLSRRGSTFHGKLVADADGYVALQPATGDTAGARRLIGLTVLADSPPTVKITTPGHDQRLPDGHRTLDIAIESTDDIGLASLELRFTKVSGSGERFSFAEGNVPLAITQHTAQRWTAHVAWKLDALGLAPGDMVVYRAVASDRRPAGGITESDSFIAEVIAPGGIAAAGFATDPEQDRYAVSQQMVILKTERLLAQRPTMAADSFTTASQEVAAEQRKVRAEFVFMLGGELADAPDLAASMTDIDETQEAESEQDILAGHMANAGHLALLRAIRAMSRAAASLAVSEPTTALPYERTALTQLERAFSHARILLRALTTRERLDLTRRLTGSLTDAIRDLQPSADAAPSARAVALRRVLSDVASIAGTKTLDTDAAGRTSALAERVLAIDPSSKPLQDVAAQLSAAANALATNRRDVARLALDHASIGLVTALRTELPEAPSRRSTVLDDRLNGALVDALRSSIARLR